MSSATIPFRERPYTQSMLLGGFTLIVCAIIAMVAWTTLDSIKQRELEDTQNMLSEVFPATLYDNHLSQEEYQLVLDGQKVHFFLARKEGKPCGVVLFADTVGYAGAISMLLGINDKGELTGVRVLSHKETPGLGDLIDLAKSHWILGFNGKSLDNTTEKQWHVKKDGGEFDSFTGATITPRGVVKGVHESLMVFAKHKEEMLNVSPEAKYE